MVVVKEVAEDEVSEEEEEKEEGKVEEVVDAETRALPECAERARGYLAELRGIIVRIEKAGEKSKLPAKFARANAYRSKLDRLNAVEANIRTVKSTLNLFIGTAHTCVPSSPFFPPSPPLPTPFSDGWPEHGPVPSLRPLPAFTPSPKVGPVQAGRALSQASHKCVWLRQIHFIYATGHRLLPTI